MIQFWTGRDDDGNQLISVIPCQHVPRTKSPEIQAALQNAASTVPLLSPYLSNPYRSSVPAYQLAVDFGSPHAPNSFISVSCGVALWLEDRQVGQRTGELTLAPRNGAASAPLSVVLGAELQPGLYKLRFWMACGRNAIQSFVPITADVLLKTPSELNLRGIAADDMAHREE